MRCGGRTRGSASAIRIIQSRSSAHRALPVKNSEGAIDGASSARQVRSSLVVVSAGIRAFCGGYPRKESYSRAATRNNRDVARLNSTN